MPASTASIIFANPKVFEKAKMDLPDDKTWTWDELMECLAEVAAKARVPFGVAQIFGSDAMFGTWLRQHGKELFTPDGPGFEVADAEAWFEMMVKFEKAKAIGTAQQISEEGQGPSAKPLAQSAVVVGNAAMQCCNTNQLEAVNAASGKEIKMLRAPSLTGKATDRKAWYKASMLWSVSAKTKQPDAAIAWINWWVNSTEAADIDKAERGIPANSELQAAHQAQAVPGAADGVEVHHRHQARARQHPDRSAARRWHVGRGDVPQPDRCAVRAGERG